MAILTLTALSHDLPTPITNSTLSPASSDPSWADCVPAGRQSSPGLALNPQGQRCPELWTSVSLGEGLSLRDRRWSRSQGEDRLAFLGRGVFFPHWWSRSSFSESMQNASNCNANVLPLAGLSETWCPCFPAPPHPFFKSKVIKWARWTSRILL